MDDALDQTRILAFVEDELTDVEAKALRADLARHPELLAKVDRLREDRAGLRAMPEPELPRDFVADLEPVLARPMLIDTQPGAYRRSRRQPRSWRWPLGVGAAAGLMIIAATALTLVIRGFGGEDGRAPNGPEMVARAPNAGGSDNDNGPIAPSGPFDDGVGSDEPGGPLHHAPPRLARAEAPVPPTRGAPRRTETYLATVPFCIELQRGDDAEAGDGEQRLLALVDGNRELALVQNFTYDEAERLEAEWLRQHAGGQQPVVADLRDGEASNAAMEELVRRMREQIAFAPRNPRNPGHPSNGSRQLAGPRGLAPSYEQQLRFSSAGATHTVTVPLAELNAFLAALDESGAGTSRLRLLAEGDDADWIASLPLIRKAIDDLEVAHPGAHVLLPVVVAGH